MDHLEINDNLCRICLDCDAVLSWDDEILEFCGISYKDCYYKYTQLNESDSDCFPKHLCVICADDLKNAHFLFDKALESFNVLQVAITEKKIDTKYLSVEICNNPPTVKYEPHASIESKPISSSESKPFSASKIINTTDDEAQIEFLSGSSEVEIMAESGNGINDSNEISMTENVTIEPLHFIDMQHFEPSDENLLEKQLKESSDIKSPKPSAANKDRKTSNKYESFPKISFEQQHNKSCDAIPAEDTKKSENRRKYYDSESSLEENLSESSTIKSELPSSSKQGAKRKPHIHILICQYCSMKVNGTHHLKIHEATHDENRERNETCPQCGIKMFNKMALTEHMKVHKENRQKNHKCEFCEKAFFHKGALNVHRRIHLGQMVKCTICSKEFYRQIDLDKHLLKHSAFPLQRNVGEVKYTIQCQYCNKSVFTRKWREHKAAHLGQPEVKCKICDKNFFSRKKCVRHLQRLHRKSRGEYEEFIHAFVPLNTRMSHLKMTQEGKVQPLVE